MQSLGQDQNLNSGSGPQSFWPQFRWKGSSESFLEHQPACFYHICSKSSVHVNLSGFVVIFGLQVLYVVAE